MSATLNFDLKKAENYFHSNPSKNFIQMGSFKNDGAPLVVKFVGKANADKIYSSAYDGKLNYSIPMEFEDLKSVKDSFEDFTNIVQEIVPHWPVNNPLARENFW